MLRTDLKVRRMEQKEDPSYSVVGMVQCHLLCPVPKIEVRLKVDDTGFDQRRIIAYCESVRVKTKTLMFHTEKEFQSC